MRIPEYVESRLRRPIPRDSCVVAGSTPVLSFGNSQSAVVATLGLNPSRIEFLDKHGVELEGDERRLATLRSLSVGQLTDASHATLAEVVSDCNSYFQRKPYRWFDQLEQILKRCGDSYYDGTGCHLDLVQWATDPTWSKLKPNIRYQLLEDDAPFLAEQLKNEKLRLLLVNGRGVLKALKRTMMPDLEECGQIKDDAYKTTALFVGTYQNIRVVGWSTNLQSSHGVTNALRSKLATRVAALAKRD